MISASNFYGKNKDSGIPLGKGTINLIKIRFLTLLLFIYISHFEQTQTRKAHIYLICNKYA